MRLPPRSCGERWRRRPRFPDDSRFACRLSLQTSGLGHSQAHRIAPHIVEIDDRNRQRASIGPSRPLELARAAFAGARHSSRHQQPTVERRGPVIRVENGDRQERVDSSRSGTWKAAAQSPPRLACTSVTAFFGARLSSRRRRTTGEGCGPVTRSENGDRRERVDSGVVGLLSARGQAK